MKILRKFKCDSLIQSEFYTRFEFLATQNAFEMDDCLHIGFFREKDVPDFQPGEIYSIEIETIPSRVLEINAGDDLPPSMRID